MNSPMANLRHRIRNVEPDTEEIGTGVEEGMLMAGCGIWRVDLLWGGWDNNGDGYCWFDIERDLAS